MHWDETHVQHENGSRGRDVAFSAHIRTSTCSWAHSTACYILIDRITLLLRAIQYVHICEVIGIILPKEMFDLTARPRLLAARLGVFNV